ncbi:hypothetical protein CVT26_003250 [Gymnopilus dilepis]|uniref:Uncharacterized protein n=1 Tax=Gymnopilus dilepis TaxID=231916 RepID=A0A409Y4Z2_9AGAR|nr:hypothetical protein CVT26_003250 [Gymnopilus dilepis]
MESPAVQFIQLATATLQASSSPPNMLFTTAKFTALLLAIAASAQASVTPRVSTATIPQIHLPEPYEELAPLSVTFYDDVNYTGRAYSPAAVPSQCFTLSGDWLDRPESVVIGAGYSCWFYVYANCVNAAAGPYTGSVASLPSNLYNNIHSLYCVKN